MIPGRSGLQRDIEKLFRDCSQSGMHRFQITGKITHFTRRSMPSQQDRFSGRNGLRSRGEGTLQKRWKPHSGRFGRASHLKRDACSRSTWVMMLTRPEAIGSVFPATMIEKFDSHIAINSEYLVAKFVYIINQFALSDIQSESYNWYRFVTSPPRSQRQIMQNKNGCSWTKAR